ncbi:hypothetical protein GQ600_9563 [Phytophthora cactorum]|nr:hypothetical protein GQ600_9563 [Phytophthora cactorum]
MSKAKEDGLFRGQRTRDLVAACLQIAHGTVSTAMNVYRADKETKLEVRCSILAVRVPYQLYIVSLSKFIYSQSLPNEEKA